MTERTIIRSIGGVLIWLAILLLGMLITDPPPSLLDVLVVLTLVVAIFAAGSLFISARMTSK